MRLKLDQNQQNFEILILQPGYDGMVKKPSHTSVPLSLWGHVNSLICFYDYRCPALILLVTC
jgi:hypothetical protein